jgi:cellulose synthase/poly-beta-1,6-N-acetylglucosamine synthase-like glycosyltransferase
LTAWLFWLCVAGVFYVYAGYPILLAVLARLRPRPEWPATETPSVTLLIAAHNEEPVIGVKLENSLELDYPGGLLQIIVAADGSDDRTAEIARSYAGRGVETSFSPERRGKTAAINRAMPSATGEIVVFSDANNLYSKDALRELVAPFADGRVGAATGAKVLLKAGGAVGESEGLYWRYESFIKEQETRLGSCTGVAGEILAVRREFFEPPPENVINDDFYIGMRIVRRGRRLVYTPRARSTERSTGSAADEIARRSRIVAGRFQAISMAGALLPRSAVTAWQVISHKFARPIVPLLMIGALAANIAAVARPAGGEEASLLLLTAPYNWALLLLQGLFYAFALLPKSGLKLSGTAGRLLYLPSFLLDSNMAALLGLFRYMTGRQSTLWHRVPRA